MNKEYIYKDGKVLIVDEDSKVTKEMKYYDNLDEVLSKENLIEKMEENIKNFAML